MRDPFSYLCGSILTRWFQVVVQRVRGAAGSCSTADQYKVLQDAGALGIVVVDDVQERLSSFRWCVFCCQHLALLTALPAFAHV